MPTGQPIKVKGTKPALSKRMRQRTEALTAARQVLEETAAASAFTRAARSAPLPEDLLIVADYILTGYRTEERDEHPTHVAIHNAGEGIYVEATRASEQPYDSISRDVTDLPIPARE